MKLLIITLMMFFLSFGVSADGKATVEKYYKYCKPLQNNGFELQGLSKKKQIGAIVCNNVLNSIKDIGARNCVALQELRKQKKINKKQFQEFSFYFANSNASTNAIISSFIKYAEDNPEKWDRPIYDASYYFLIDKFSCKQKESSYILII